MQNEFIEKIGEIGEVRFVKSAKAKRINISIKPNKGVRVAIPKRASIKAAKAFVIQKEEWIIKHLEKIKVAAPQLTFDENTTFKTRTHTLSIEKENRDNLNARVEPGHVKVSIPDYIDVRNEEVQKFIKHALTETLRTEAKSYIPGRISELANKHGFSFNALRLKNMHTRWGSCSARNNINLSIHLMLLPDHLIDLIILHELCHTVHKNHGPDFKNLLNEVSGDRVGLEREMKTHRMLLK